MDLEKEKKMWMKIVARNSSVGCSSRISYYYGSGEGVPFKWEIKPGVPKHHPPKESELPPLSPPPALLSLGLPKPSIHYHHHLSRASTTWFTRLRRRWWKRITRKSSSGKEGNKLQQRSGDINDDIKDLDVFERFLECNSDFDSSASPRESSFSSSSSSASSSLCRPSMQTTRSESLYRKIYGRPLNCIPMRFTRILISIVKRD